MESFDDRMVILDEMFSIYFQETSEKKLRAYLRNLKDIPTDVLRVAVTGCVQNGTQRGCPTVAEIRRRAGDTSTQSQSGGEIIAAERRVDVARRRLAYRGVKNPSETLIQLEIAQFPQVFGDHAAEEARRSLGEP